MNDLDFVKRDFKKFVDHLPKEEKTIIYNWDKNQMIQIEFIPHFSYARLQKNKIDHKEAKMQFNMLKSSLKENLNKNVTIIKEDNNFLNMYFNAIEKFMKNTNERNIDIANSTINFNQKMLEYFKKIVRQEKNLEKIFIQTEFKINIMFDIENLFSGGEIQGNEILALKNALKFGETKFKFSPFIKEMFRSQGYKYIDLLNVYKNPTNPNDPNIKSPFITSFLKEIDQVYSKICFVTPATIAFKDFENIMTGNVKEINLKGLPLGLYSPTEGYGSKLGIKLEKNFYVSTDYIFIDYESKKNKTSGYSVNEVYGNIKRVKMNEDNFKRKGRF